MPTTVQPFIHIDTQLHASHYRVWLWAGVTVAIAGMIGLLTLPISYKVALWILLLACVVVSQLASQQLLAVSSLPAKRSNKSSHEFFLSDTDWQIQCVQGYFLTPFGQTSDIYQAKLVSVTAMGRAVLVIFSLFEPFDKRLSVTVWQDQVDSDTWRQWQVLARQSFL